MGYGRKLLFKSRRQEVVAGPSVPRRYGILDQFYWAYGQIRHYGKTHFRFGQTDGCTRTRIKAHPNRFSEKTALAYAKLMIDNASDAISGRVTELLPLLATLQELPVAKCPTKLPKLVEDKNFCEYKGYYHTDYTIPSEYFSPDVERPKGLCPHRLDFTYLFDNDPLSPDRLRLKEGVRVRGTKKQKTVTKRGKAHGKKL